MQSIKKYLKIIVLLALGIVIGWFIFHKSNSGTKTNDAVTVTKNQIWTCSMHPQIRSDKPGLCPLCGMELIPLQQGTSQVDPDAIVMSEDAVKLADVQTNIVSLSQPVKEMRLFGKIQADERLVQTQPSHLPGRIDQLFVSFTGEVVTKGQVIAQIYAPTLLTAQQELIEAKKMGDEAIIDAIREKLKQWKLTDNQIAEIEKSGKVKTLFDVTATVSGVVINKKVNRGDYVSQGTPLYEIADLSHVWALFDAYETDLQWIKLGTKTTFTLQSMPEKKYEGIVSFIDPVINPQTRIARIRVDVDNSDNSLKPEMFVTGSITTQLETNGKSLVIPQSSVLWTGARSIVYVKMPNTTEPTFLMREIKLGPSLSNSYVVLDGLKDGEEIVTNGTFSVDAAAQLSGKASMMNEVTEKNVKKDEVETTNKKIPDFKNKTDRKFKQQLTTMYDDYIKLKDAFVATDAKKTGDIAKTVKSSLGEVDMKLLNGESHKIWMEYSEKMEKDINEIISEKDIKKQKEYFATFSNIFYQAIKTFGLNKVESYYQFCPMAFDNKGAYWLSSNKEISNPYFGKAMLRCGETKETIK